MPRVSGVPIGKPIETDRTDVQGDDADEQMFGSVLAAIARKLWEDNTAPNLAAEAGCSVRAAEFYLSGGRKWSGDAVAAVVAEILKRHKMRNVRVMSRN